MRTIGLPESARTSGGTQYFSGYNHCLRTDAGEVFDCKNMTMDVYPFLASRSPRGKIAFPGDVKVKDLLVADVAMDEVLYENAYIVQTENSIEVYDSEFNHLIQLTADLEEEQKMVLQGAHLVCFPSTKYYNILDLDGDDYGVIRYSVSASVLAPIKFQPCDEEGNVITTVKPENPTTGTLWNDHGSVLLWSEASNSWTETETTYCVLSGHELNSKISGAGAHEGDIIEFKGGGTNGMSLVYVGMPISDQTSDKPRAMFKGCISKEVGGSISVITATHRVPNFDFVFESNNRIWGCYYGLNEDGEAINEIYASALGDFRNFYKYEGISTDSWTAAIGVPGKWTGGCKYGTYPTFFKENAIVRVYGEYASTYGTYTSNFRGVKPGNGESLCIVNETLYYNSPAGIVSYTGGLPYNVDNKLHEIFEKVIAGRYRGKLYLNCTRKDGSSSLLVYDTVKQMWIKEDALNVKKFIATANDLFMITDSDTYTVAGGDEAFEWSFETAMLGLEYADHKYISRVQMRIEGDGEIGVYISYNGGDWEDCVHYVCRGITPILADIPARRCDYFRLKAEGVGTARILTMNYLVENGSDNIET